MRATLSSWMGGGGHGGDVSGDAWVRMEAPQPLPSDPFKAAGGWWPVQRDIPLFAWPMLVAAVLAISSAATVFEEMREVPAVTLAAWRLQLTSVLLLVGAVWQWRRDMEPEERSRALRSWRLITASGTCLAVHFGSWVWGLEHTTLTHSLLLVCSAPLLIAAGTYLMKGPLSRGEMLGTALGFLGGIVLAFGPRSGREEEAVTLMGDLASLLAAVAIIGYLMIGRSLRQWMPIFVYAFPVTACAAVLLTLAALAIDGASVVAAGGHGVFGYLGSGHYAPWVLYLAVGPGIVGHTGFNTLLRYMTPLTVSLAFQLEPLVGSLMGWAAGVVDAPGWSTYVGGLLVLAATCWVTYASVERQQREEWRGTAAVELEQVFQGEEDSLMPLSLGVPAEEQRLLPNLATGYQPSSHQHHAPAAKAASHASGASRREEVDHGEQHSLLGGLLMDSSMPHHRHGSKGGANDDL